MWLLKASNVFVVQEITKSPLEANPAQVVGCRQKPCKFMILR